MATYLLLVHTRPVTGREEEYHRWYDDVHLAEVLTVPGFIGGRRFGVDVPGFVDPPLAGPASFVAVFTVESDDIDATMATFDDMRRRFMSSPAIDLSSVTFELLRPIGR